MLASQFSLQDTLRLCTNSRSKGCGVLNLEKPRMLEESSTTRCRMGKSMVTRMYLKTIPSLEMVLRIRWEMDALVSMRMVDTFVIVELLEQRGGVPAVVQHPHGQSLLGDEEVTHQFLQSQQALGLEMRTRR